MGWNSVVLGAARDGMESSVGLSWLSQLPTSSIHTFMFLPFHIQLLRTFALIVHICLTQIHYLLQFIVVTIARAAYLAFESPERQVHVCLHRLSFADEYIHVVFSQPSKQGPRVDHPLWPFIEMDGVAESWGTNKTLAKSSGPGVSGPTLSH